MSDLVFPSSTPPPTGRRPRLGYAMTLSAATLFAINGAVSKLALDASGIGTPRWTELRTTGTFAGIALVLLLLAPRRLRIASRRDALHLAVYGIVGFAIVQWLYFVAIDRLEIGIALLFEFTAPVFIALWVRFVWHQPVRSRVWLALALIVLGLGLVAQIWSGLALDTLGVVAGLAAAVTLALYYLMGERLVARRDPLSLVCLAAGFATVCWAVVQPWWNFPFEILSVEVALPGPLGTAPVWALALWTIVLGTIVPYVLSVNALRHLPATTVGIIATFEPVAASVVAWVWLDETLLAVQIVGGLIVLAGILLAETSH